MNRSFWTRGMLAEKFVLIGGLIVTVCGGLLQRRVP